jgi:hypothetical protein
MNGARLGIAVVIFSITIMGCSVLRPGSDRMVKEPHYSLIIDAGSSGSRIYIYHIEPNRFDNLPGITLLGNSKVEPGISEWESDPESARNNLESLLTVAKENIDAQDWKNTSLYLMATAGMRLLSSAKRQRIMTEISDFFLEDGSFVFKQAVVISGAYEGLYSWIAANYLDDYFDPLEAREGIIEMGGASTQIAFVTSNRFGEDSVRRRFRNKQYHVYTKSYLYMGLHQAQRWVDAASCYPVGYPISSEKGTGMGNFNVCSAEIMEQFTAMCENLENNGPHCIFKQKVTPLLETNFYAISSFYYAFSFLGLKEQVDLTALQVKGDDLCSKDWGDLQRLHNKTPEKYLSSYCFSAAYFWVLISNGYGFSHDMATIRPVEKIDGTEVSWTLGALIDIELGNDPINYRPGE